MPTRSPARLGSPRLSVWSLAWCSHCRIRSLLGSGCGRAMRSDAQARWRRPRGRAGLLRIASLAVTREACSVRRSRAARLRRCWPRTSCRRCVPAGPAPLWRTWAVVAASLSRSPARPIRSSSRSVRALSPSCSPTLRPPSRSRIGRGARCRRPRPSSRIASICGPNSALRIRRASRSPSALKRMSRL